MARKYTASEAKYRAAFDRNQRWVLNQLSYLPFEALAANRKGQLERVAIGDIVVFLPSSLPGLKQRVRLCNEVVTGLARAVEKRKMQSGLEIVVSRMMHKGRLPKAKTFVPGARRKH
jgi:hypothetical protein